MNKLFGPEYGISAILRRAADEWRDGMLTLVRTEARITDSRRVGDCWRRGRRRPLKNAAGL